eukprot:Em0010g592a
MDPFFITDGNTTMLDYNGAVEFTLFAVNGAGNGNAAAYILQRKIPTDVASPPNQTIPAAGNTSSTPASNNTTSADHIYGTVIIFTSVCAVLGTVLGTVIVVVLVIAVVRCFKKKKSKGTPNDFGNERAVNTTDGLSSDSPSRAIGGNSSCTPEQSTTL